MKSTHKYEYVMSACAHTRISIESGSRPDSIEKIKKVIDIAESKFKNHQFTTLYNAFTEAQLGQSMYNAGFIPNPMHSDSGGLQIITRGLTADNEIKKKVYQEQAKYSGYAMCFDEIPVETIGHSKIGNISNRIFRTDWIEAKAKQTCENICRQAQVFHKMGAKTKIMLIVQGNCYDTYMKWIDACVKYLPKEVYPFIGGMSFAGTSSGSGELEDVERLFSFGICDAPEEWKKGLHLLGVGSVRRLLPLVGFLYSGLINNVKISYDSTTHSSNVTYRRFNDIDNSVVVCGNNAKGAKNENGMWRLYSLCKDYYDIESDFDMFRNIFSENRDSFINRYGEDNLCLFHEALISTCMVSVLHITGLLDNISEDINAFKSYSSDICPQMMALTSVTNKTSFDYYMKELGKYLDSSRIKKSNETSSIEMLDLIMPTSQLPKPQKNKIEKSSLEEFM